VEAHGLSAQAGISRKGVKAILFPFALSLSKGRPSSANSRKKEQA